MNLSAYIAKQVVRNESNSFVKLILNIATASVSIGLVVMIMALNIISGFETEISEKIFDFWGHISIKDINSRKSIEAIPIDLNMLPLDTIAELENVEYEMLDRNTDSWNMETANGGIKRLSPIISFPGILQSPEGMEGVVLKGIPPSKGSHELSNYIVKGAWLDSSNNKRQIILSESTSSRIQRDVGDKIVIHFIKDGKQLPKVFYVQGIYRTGLEEYEKVTSLTDLNTLQEILDWNESEVGSLEIVLDDVNDLYIYSNYINYEILPSNIYARSIRTELSSIFKWLELQSVNKALILGLLIAICIINMITAVLILILERTSLIGTLKTLGATNWTIRKIFLRYGAYIIIKALLIGNIVGLGLSYLQYSTQFIKMDEKNYYISYVPIEFQWDEIFLLNIGTFVLIVAFLLIPSALISRIRPVKVLRFE